MANILTHSTAEYKDRYWDELETITLYGPGCDRVLQQIRQETANAKRSEPVVLVGGVDGQRVPLSEWVKMYGGCAE